MTILFIARSTLYISPGGDTIQIIRTAQELSNLGVNVDIMLTNQKIEYKKYDIIHFFNIIRPADILLHFKYAKKTVISTIFVDYTEVEKNIGSILRKALIYFLGSYKLEYLKALAKAILGKEKIVSTEFIFKGQFKSIKYLYKNSNAILPNSISELNRLEKEFGKTTAISKKIVNAIEVKDNITPKTEYENSIICVGRIEKLKNQYNVIKAANELNIPCFIIGKPSINDIKYYNSCKEIAGSNIKFIKNLPQEEIFQIMSAAKVHVLASWFETTGLVSLEAAYYGCNIVITKKGDQMEYFGTNAFYCNPDCVNSIKKSILEAYNAPFNFEFKEIIKQNYSWKNTALQTKEVYDKIIGR